MSFFPGIDPVPGDVWASDLIETMIVASAKDIGGFEVRRALPSAKRRLVGPFIFFDQMGPAILRPGQMLDVRPHPHIGLATVTYLFDGKIRHRDSLGTEMVIAPGDVNLMTAGRGIVHSERTPEELRSGPMAMSGLQTWIALPEAVEDMAPTFSNTGVAMLPAAQAGGVSLRVIKGEFAGLKAPTRIYSDTVYVDAKLDAGARLQLPPDIEERAIYVLDGEVSISGDVFDQHKLLLFRPGGEIVISSPRGAHFVILGGASIGSKRYIWWNFVSSSQEKIEQAKEEWRTGRFDIVPGDAEEFIPLPS